VTVGVFDGVHRGHRYLLDQLVAWAAEGEVDPVVLTFDPHPRAVLGQEPPELLTSLEHRLLLLERSGARGTVVVPFDRELASWTAADFVRRVYVEALGASRVLVGRNHRFGKGRQGDLALLQRLGAEHGFEAREVELETLGPDQVISSTAIRDALRRGDLDGAARLLGRPVSVLGDVVPGERRGRELGFPTANLDLHHSARPASGVYAARARTVPADDPAGPLRPAVVNVGRRPTFHPEADVDLVEVHLLDVAEDLYGARLEVVFLAKLRDEQRFDGPAALKAQIEADVARARTLLADAAPEPGPR